MRDGGPDVSPFAFLIRTYSKTDFRRLFGKVRNNKLMHHWFLDFSPKPTAKVQLFFQTARLLPRKSLPFSAKEQKQATFPCFPMFISCHTEITEITEKGFHK